MNQQEALAQALEAIRDYEHPGSRAALDFASLMDGEGSPAADHADVIPNLAAAILDALPEGVALVTNWDEMTLHLQELGASLERERLWEEVQMLPIGYVGPTKVDVIPRSVIIDLLTDPDEADR